MLHSSLENILTTWMSQEVCKWLVNGVFHLLINGVYWGYNPLTNHLLTSWDIQVYLLNWQEMALLAVILQSQTPQDLGAHIPPTGIRENRADPIALIRDESKFWAPALIFFLFAAFFVRFGAPGWLFDIGDELLPNYMGGPPKIIGKPPQIVNFYRVFHDFLHPFWGTPIFGNTHIGIIS